MRTAERSGRWMRLTTIVHSGTWSGVEKHRAVSRRAGPGRVATAIVTLGVRSRGALTDQERRVIRFGALWFVAFYAITGFFRSDRASTRSRLPSGARLRRPHLQGERCDRTRGGSGAWLSADRVVALLLPVTVHGSRARGARGSGGRIAVDDPGCGPKPGTRGAVVIVDRAGERDAERSFGTLFTDAVISSSAPAGTGRWSRRHRQARPQLTPLSSSSFATARWFQPHGNGIKASGDCDSHGVARLVRCRSGHPAPALRVASRIPDPGSRIPDPGSRIPDPGSGSRIPGLPASDKRHLRRHHGDELHVDVKRSPAM